VTSLFLLIFEEFEDELAAIEALVDAAADPNLGRPKARVAGANAAALLLAAAFEEFIRECARAYAKASVESCGSYEDLPPKMAPIAWKRTMENLARVHLNPKKEIFSRESIFADALTRFTVTYEFCKGDITQDIYQDLIHNENSMRPQEINTLFNISALGNACGLASEQEPLLSFFNEINPGKTLIQFVESLDEFFERRNKVAHSLNLMSSSGPSQIKADISLLRAFSRALALALEIKAPLPPTAPPAPSSTTRPRVGLRQRLAEVILGRPIR